MRFFNTCLCLAILSMTGCLYGAGQAKTRTVIRQDNGLYPVTETSIEQTYEGRTVGASMPFAFGGGYDPATGMAYGQNGFGNGGSSQFCVLYPDRCASNVTVNVPQASVLVTNGYGSSTLQISAGGNAQTVPAGAPGTYGEPSGPPVDISEMQERLAAVEKKTNVMVPVLKKSVEVQCQQVLAHPEDIKDAKERELEVQSCTAKLKK